MPEVLRVEVADEARTLGAPAAVLDPAMAEVVAAAVAEAEERGRRAGERAGRAAAEDAARRGADAAVRAVEAMHAEVVDQRERACAATVELAADLAEQVLGRTPPDDALDVLARVREAVATLDDDPLELRLHPEDHAALAGAVTEPRLRLVVDPSLAPGDARIVGAWGGAELTRTDLVEAATRAHLEGGADE